MLFRLFASFFITATIIACAAADPRPDSSSSHKGASNVLLDFYQGPLNHLSAVRGGECPMYPSCSEYSRQVFAKYGPVRGWIMTLDRLMRCGRDEIHLAPRVFVRGKWKYYDPPAYNDGQFYQATPPTSVSTSPSTRRTNGG